MGGERHLSYRKLLVFVFFFVFIGLPISSFGETYNLKEYFPVEQGEFLNYKVTVLENDVDIEVESQYGDSKVVINGVECTKCVTRGGEMYEYGGWYEDGLRLYKSKYPVEDEYRIYEPYILICPLTLETGEPFTSECIYKIYESGVITEQGPLKVELRALGEEEVTVPAGTFNCLKIYGRVEWKPPYEPAHSGEGYIWLARGIGLIKLDVTPNVVDGREPRVYELLFGFIPVCKGDFDNDGDVDGADLAIFALEFGRTDCLP